MVTIFGNFAKGARDSLFQMARKRRSSSVFYNRIYQKVMMSEMYAVNATDNQYNFTIKMAIFACLPHTSVDFNDNTFRMVPSDASHPVQ